MFEAVFLHSIIICKCFLGSSSSYYSTVCDNVCVFYFSKTGVAFKEGLCYNKWEAAGLFGTVPLLLLGHLFSFLPVEGERGALAAMCCLLTVSRWRVNGGPWQQCAAS